MNAQYNKVCVALQASAYKVIRHHRIDLEKEEKPDLIIEWWSGPKGTVIVQREAGQPGVQTFCDWPLGNTFDELEFALEATDTLEGVDRTIHVEGRLWSGGECHMDYDLDAKQPIPTSMKEAQKIAGDFQSLSIALLVQDEWRTVQKTTTTELK